MATLANDDVVHALTGMKVEVTSLKKETVAFVLEKVSDPAKAGDESIAETVNNTKEEGVTAALSAKTKKAEDRKEACEVPEND